MLTGENGIITQAIEAQEKTDIADEKERVQLAAVAAAGKDVWGGITEDNLAEELTKNIGKRNEDYTLTKEGENFLVTYIDSNRSYLVDENGNVTYTGESENPGEGDGDGETIPDRSELKVGDYIDYAWHGYVSEDEPIAFINPYNAGTSYTQNYTRKPFAGLSESKYGKVHIPFYGEQNEYFEDPDMTWILNAIF